MICPYDSVLVFDGEGADSVQGLEIMGVGEKVFRAHIAGLRIATCRAYLRRPCLPM